MDSVLRGPENRSPREVILLLHGFAETGERIFKKIFPAIPKEIADHAVILAPNAPFPMPVKTETGYIATFSWYFYDPAGDDYFIDMVPATEFLTQGLEKLGLASLPKRIIGFSQGGFLAPIAATSLTQVRQFIGIGCEYLVDEVPGTLPANIPYRIDAIHGSQDESVSVTRAQESYERIKNAGVLGSFTLIPDGKHRIDDRVRAAVEAALKSIEPA